MMAVAVDAHVCIGQALLDQALNFIDWKHGLWTCYGDGREAFICEQCCVGPVLCYQVRCHPMHGEPVIRIWNRTNDSTARSDDVSDFGDRVLIDWAGHEAVYVT